MWCCNPNTDQSSEYYRAGRLNRHKLKQINSTYGQNGQYSKNEDFNPQHSKTHSFHNTQPLKEQNPNIQYNTSTAQGMNNQGIPPTHNMPPTNATSQIQQGFNDTSNQGGLMNQTFTPPNPGANNMNFIS